MSLLLVKTISLCLFCKSPSDHETRHIQLQIEHKRKKPPLGGKGSLHAIEASVEILMEVIGLLRELHGKEQEVACSYANA